MQSLSTPVKATIVGVSVGVFIIGVLATVFKRRKPRSTRKPVVHRNSINSRSRSYSPLSAKSPNGDIPSCRNSQHSNSPSIHHLSLNSRRHNSHSLSSSTSTITHNLDTSTMSPQQLCQMGLDSLNNAIHYWEDALLRIQDDAGITHIGNGDVTDGETFINEEEKFSTAVSSDLRQQIENLIDRSYQIQEEYERRLYRQASAAALDSALTALSEMDRVYERERRSTMSDDSDQDSFVSASEMADLSDMVDQNARYQHLYMYKAALLELEHGVIPCRELRTKMVRCSSDSEFLAKLHCLRLAFEELFSDVTILKWFIDMGRQLLTDILIKADRDPEDFQIAFDEMIEYVSIAENRKSMEDELRGRGVKVISFYDVVLDFILMDAFDDLESPPTSVTTVVQNRWLSNGFKETALATAVWSVLKAKRRLLKVPNGFIAHFYAISEHMSPVLAWGFLGPNEQMNRLCYFFKDQVMEFLYDAFSFSKVRFTTVPEMADDVLNLARERSVKISEFLSR
ncbi:mitoguardin-like isoform X2 [Tubulanus polymorphus]|uniref:mitoguardin-like isoform X2 n=1 Tax=Tubulanus polymorphus TaxID=672921 RepID=UPI003DA5A243